MPEVISKKLKFKGDKPKKKKRSHAPKTDELDALAAEDPSGELRRDQGVDNRVDVPDERE